MGDNNITPPQLAEPEHNGGDSSMWILPFSPLDTERQAKGAQTSIEQGVNQSSEQPVGISSTTGQNPQQLQTGGVDSLVVKVFGQFDPEKHKHNCNSLLQAREAAKVNDLEGSFTKIGKHDCQLLPKSWHSGTESFPYLFDCKGFNFCVSQTIEYKEKVPVVKVTPRAETLMAHGHQGAWELAKQILQESFHLDIKDTQVSRIDLAVDLPDLAALDITRLLQNPNHFITRAKQAGGRWAPGHEPESIWIGKKPQCKCYNKVKEINEQSIHKKPLMISLRWGSEIEVASRVEFTVPRDTLRNTFRLSTVDEVFASLSTIATHLTSKSFRLVEHYDGKNPSRAINHPVWNLIVDRLQAWTQNTDYIAPIIEKPLPDVTRLRDMSKGCMQSAIAMMGLQPETKEEYLALILDEFEFTAFEDIKKIAQKRKSFAARGAISNAEDSQQDIMNRYLQELNIA